MRKILLLLFLLLPACRGVDALVSGPISAGTGGDIDDGISHITPERGGSNYAFIDLGRYAADPTDANWVSDVKNPVAHYRDWQARVREQLDAMRASGQQKIALIVWFGGPGQTCVTYAHTICPQNGKFPSAIKANLQDLLNDVMDRGFSEVQIRFGGQGNADVNGWTQFEEAYYLNNESFIFDGIDITEAATAGRPVQVYYDLGIELMGHAYVTDRAWNNQYLRRLWAAYIAKYPAAKSVGFSFNHVQRQASYESLKIFDDSGKRPARLALDIYANRPTYFQNIQWVLDLKGWGRSFPIYLQETFRNSASVARDILDARSSLGLNIRSVEQWPLDEGAATPHANSVDYSFDQYR